MATSTPTSTPDVTELPIEAIHVSGRHRKDLGDIPELAASIEAIGLLHPIVVTSDHKLIVGERRLEAYKLLGRDTIPANVAKNLIGLGSLLRAEADENTSRLALDPEEAVAIGGAIEKAYRPRAEAAQRAGGGDKKSPQAKSLTGTSRKRSRQETEATNTTAVASAAVGMDRRTYEKAKAVLAHGDAEVIAKMNQTRKVDPAYKAVKKAEKAAADAAAAKKAVKVLAKEGVDDGLVHGDFREASLKLPDNSVALIFTDPPYDRDSLPLFADLAGLAARVLVDGGSLVTFAGQYALADIMARINVHLRFFWICCCLHTGGTEEMREYGIKVKWKPLLWFVKGKFRRAPTSWIEDLVVSEQQKGLHPWQQSTVEAKHFIEALTQPGEIVFDPFCGSGTTAVAAKALGRSWLTCDTEPTCIVTARKRMMDGSRLAEGEK